MTIATQLSTASHGPEFRQAATLFFQLISRCYERGAMVLTSNQGVGNWGDVVGDRVIGSAILDRILHYATTVSMRGDSYRLKDKLKSEWSSRRRWERERWGPWTLPSPWTA